MYNIIKGPTNVQPGHAMPISLDMPPYAETGVVPPSFARIKAKSPKEIESMRLACYTARKVLWTIKDRIKVSNIGFFLPL